MKKVILGLMTVAILGLASCSKEEKGDEIFIECEPSGSINNHDYIDIGLSVKWATHNIGAENSYEAGDYFAWGETSPKETYKWSNYKYIEINDQDTVFPKYNILEKFGPVDQKGTLEKSDDAAVANWGDPWRMPTFDELNELSSKCDWRMIVYNGVNCFKVTGPNGKYIVIPLTGFIKDQTISNVGTNLALWSSNLSQSASNRAYELTCYDGIRYKGSVNRYYGDQIRPVTK